MNLSCHSGWEEMIDAETGIPFFVDHNTQTTSWVDPRDIFTKKLDFNDCDGNELPFGWEEAYDPSVGMGAEGGGVILHH